MNMDALKNSSVLLLGKPRAFSMSEFEKQLRHHHITVMRSADIREQSHEICAVIEGGLLNPLEQDLLEQRYFENAIPIVRMDTLEHELARHLNANTLLMSLKLTKDKERLHGFLTNALIDEGIFIKLLKLYDFNGEGFFDTDANRDVTTALIERFYDNLEQNHNIQYISMGVVELINKSTNAELIDVMASLSIVKHSLRHGGDALMEAVLFALAQHRDLALVHQIRIAQSDREALCLVLASREGLDPSVEALLLQSQHQAVLTALASNARLSSAGVAQLLETHEEQIIAHVRIHETYFESFCRRNPVALAANPTLSSVMFVQLLALNRHAVDLALATNVSLPHTVALALYERDNMEVKQRLACNVSLEKSLLEHFLEEETWHESLAKNPALDEQTIYRLYRNTNRNVLEALAANEATPLDILYELLLDMHFEPIVRQNSALNTKYQR